MITKNTKTPRGLTGFSSKTNSVDGWTINVSYGTSLIVYLREFLGGKMKIYVHTDLQQLRTRKEQDDISSLLVILDEFFIDFFSENLLLSISNRILAT